MYNITLVSTLHSERGICNSNELYRIFESLSPEIIFEEMCPDLHDRFYNKNQIPFETLETKAVKMYLLNNNAQNVPVDIDPDPNISMHDIQHMFSTFKKYAVYSRLEDEQYIKTEKEGFSFLNSQEFIDLNQKKKLVEIELLEFMSKQLLLHRIHKQFYNEQETREYKWLENIYEFSSSHSYEKAIFYCGASHRESVLQKIDSYKVKYGPNLNWTLIEN